MMKGNQKGQTLLETIVAIGVVMIGLIAVLTLSTYSITAGRQAESRVVAVNLSREGIEVAREIRDSNWLELEADSSSLTKWDDGLYDPGDNSYTAILEFDAPTNSWTFNFANETFENCTDLPNARSLVYLGQLEGTNLGEYIQQETDPGANYIATPFHRCVVLYPICDNNGEDNFLDTNGETCGLYTQEKIGIQAISWVKWREGGRTLNEKIEERIYNWKPGVVNE